MQIERGAVGEEAPPLRIEWHKIERRLEITPRLSPDPPQHAGDRQDGRPHVEAVARLGEHRRLAPHPVILVAERDGIAAGSKCAGCRQAAEPSPDYHHSLVFFAPLHSCSRSIA